MATKRARVIFNHLPQGILRGMSFKCGKLKHANRVLNAYIMAFICVTRTLRVSYVYEFEKFAKYHCQNQIQILRVDAKESLTGDEGRYSGAIVSK